jgi:hypothetical protein
MGRRAAILSRQEHERAQEPVRTLAFPSWRSALGEGPGASPPSNHCRYRHAERPGLARPVPRLPRSGRSASVVDQAYEAGLDAQLKLADTDPEDPARADPEAIADHCEWARRMIESNLRLVVSIARRFSATSSARPLDRRDLHRGDRRQRQQPAVLARPCA